MPMRLPSGSDRELSAASRARKRHGTARDKGERGIDKSGASGPLQIQPRDGLIHQARKPFGFGDRDAATEFRDPVVNAALVIELRIGALVRFFDPSILDHAFDRS